MADHSSRTLPMFARVIMVPVAVAAVIALLVLAFVWPTIKAAPTGLTIAITGDKDLVAAFTTSAGAALGDAVTLTTVDDRAAALAGIESREFIGGIVMDSAKPEVLKSSAAGQVQSQIMGQVATQLQVSLDAQMYAGLKTAFETLQKATVGGGVGPQGVTQKAPAALPTVTVTDVVPLTSADSAGGGLTAAGMPLTVGGLLCGVLVGAMIRGAAWRFTGLLVASLGGGAVATAILGTWLGIYPARFVPVFLALSASMFAIGGLFVGLHSLIGTPGFGLAALIMVFAALPWAGFAVPPQFLPAHLGDIGQWLPPGATATLVRTLNYFPGASTLKPWLILGGWAVVCAVLVFLGRSAKSRRTD
ncbi:MAG: hypothetical protein LBI33_14485 [Propionibacteriaceae bacterium]|jgi:hypothetical protein|nr:hypothetical protein [Propionibacteriaceae bacterium]